MHEMPHSTSFKCFITQKGTAHGSSFLLFRFLLYIRPCAGDAQWVRRRNSRGLSSRLRAGFRADSTRAVTFCPLRCRISRAPCEPRPSPNRRREQRASDFRARSCRPQQMCLRLDPRAREQRSRAVIRVFVDAHYRGVELRELFAVLFIGHRDYNRRLAVHARRRISARFEDCVEQIFRYRIRLEAARAAAGFYHLKKISVHVFSSQKAFRTAYQLDTAALKAPLFISPILSLF